MSADQQAELAAEIAHEQSHVDRVYTELAKAATRADLVHAEGMVQGQTERAGTGDPREEEMAGLFQRDALVSRLTAAAPRWSSSTRGWSLAALTSMRRLASKNVAKPARCATSVGWGAGRRV
ncbi:hypothetical protein [Ornithinimicrobium sp. INDO-MA30-4]|uniref:hypothetical protein n=1 Tax=Ornithinimicrobium sp. INDO-MA30-4 TaxID=2908651 RepID=UPI0028834ABC|nr:hypothetical protein [Ornithinimicrobium sp. INDO-MA30-4]